MAVRPQIHWFSYEDVIDTADVIEIAEEVAKSLAGDDHKVWSGERRFYSLKDHMLHGYNGDGVVLLDPCVNSLKDEELLFLMRLITHPTGYDILVDKCTTAPFVPLHIIIVSCSFYGKAETEKKILGKVKPSTHVVFNGRPSA